MYLKISKDHSSETGRARARIRRARLIPTKAFILQPASCQEVAVYAIDLAYEKCEQPGRYQQLSPETDYVSRDRSATSVNCAIITY